MLPKSRSAPQVHRADAARSAGDEAADRRGGEGGGHHALFLARMGARLGVESLMTDAGLGHHAAGVNLLHLGHVLHVHHAAAAHRHGLPVIPGARAARRDRHIMGIAGAEPRSPRLRISGSPRNRPIRWSISAFRIGEYQKKSRLFVSDRGRVVVLFDMVKGGLGGGDVWVHCPRQVVITGRVRRSRAVKRSMRTPYHQHDAVGLRAGEKLGP
jgi:hypothetical protein